MSIWHTFSTYRMHTYADTITTIYNEICQTQPLIKNSLLLRPCHSASNFVKRVCPPEWIYIHVNGKCSENIHKYVWPVGCGRRTQRAISFDFSIMSASGIAEVRNNNVMSSILLINRCYWWLQLPRLCENGGELKMMIFCTFSDSCWPYVNCH